MGSTGADLGVKECLWAQCHSTSVELVETATGVIFALCHVHAEVERAIARSKRTNG